MKTEMILKEIAAKGEITERQISLLKCRSNKVQKDLYDYANEDVRVSADQGAKGGRVVALPPAPRRHTAKRQLSWFPRNRNNQERRT